MASRENRVLLPLHLNNNPSSIVGIKPKTDSNHLSPVTDLTLNLCGLNTGNSGTPRRKFSWSGGTPVTTFVAPQGSESPAVDSPMFQERLFRQVSIENLYSGTLRRIHTFPSRALQPQDKENVPTNRFVVPSPAVDSESEDSGCHLAQEGKSASFTDLNGSFSLPRKLKLAESPSKEQNDSVHSQSNPTDESPRHHFSFVMDEDDGFLDVFNMDDHDQDEHLPSGMSDLLTAPIVQEQVPESQTREVCTHVENRRVPIRRCLSMVSENEQERRNSTYSANCVSLMCHGHLRKAICPSGCDRNNNNQEESRKRLSNDENDSSNTDTSLKIAFKRPEPPGGVQHTFECKRRKSVTFVTRCSSDSQVILSTKKQSPIRRSHSASEATIKLALEQSVQEPDLIGDFSKTFALPLEKGRHEDLKAISIHSLADLMKGRYNHLVDYFTVVDCRYPYEYDGGHIQGAKNIFTKEGILEEFLSNITISANRSQRHLVVFHCEFSSERGPSLYRFLRNKDRESNKDNYPKLHHPELYVLEGGYKAFYEAYKEFCMPQLYKPMLHKDHENDLRKFRAKSKSWNGDSKSRLAVRPGLKL